MSTDATAEAPTKKRKKGSAKKAVKDSLTRLAEKLNRTKPRTAGGPSAEISITGENTLVMSRVKYILKTGIKPLDDLISPVCFGRVGEYYGLDASGKTALMKLLAARAQQGMIFERVQSNGSMTLRRVKTSEYQVTILFVDNESSITDDAAVDDSEAEQESGQDNIVVYDSDTQQAVPLKMALVRCDTVSTFFKMVENTIDFVNEEEKKTGLTQFLIVICDTIAGTSSNEEISQEWGKEDYSRQPKQLKQGFRKLIRKINQNNVAVCCTNQVSDSFVKTMNKVKSKFPRDEDFSTFGGRALKFFASTRVFMTRWMGKYVLSPRVDFDDGLLIQVTATKNRIKMPFRSCCLVLLFDPKYGGYNNEYSVLETLIAHKAIDKEKEGKEYKFKVMLSRYSLSPDGTNQVVDDDDESGEDAVKTIASVSKKRGNNPSFVGYLNWPTFYEENRAVVDELWNRVVKAAFTTSVSSLGFTVDVDSDEIDEFEEEEDF